MLGLEEHTLPPKNGPYKVHQKVSLHIDLSLKPSSGSNTQLCKVFSDALQMGSDTVDMNAALGCQNQHHELPGCNRHAGAVRHVLDIRTGQSRHWHRIHQNGLSAGVRYGWPHIHA